MSDKKEVGLNEVDIQAVIAAWIIANDGCGSSNNDVDCYGERGIFKGTVCQFYRRTGCIASGDTKVGEAKAWLEKYHQQKAEAAEAEKRKAEAAKKEEQGVKQEPKKICGNCQHASKSVGFKGTIPCEWRNINVPAGNPGCHYFEPRNTTCQSPSVSSEDVANAVAYTERIAQLEKENARLAFSVNCHEKKMEWAVELCESGECDAKKDRAELAAKCECLTEQRNKLSNDLIQAMRRMKEVEVCCSLKTRLIDQLRKENAGLRSALEQASEDRKHLVEQLSDGEGNHLYTVTNLYAYKPTAEEFLVMKGLYRQK